VRTVARKNKKQGSHENHERWLVTYADLITLLLVFFIIMYAMSKIDMNKYEVLARALNFQFTKSDSPIVGGKGIIGTVGKTTSDSEANKKGDPEDQTKPNKEKEKEQADKLQQEKELQNLLAKVQAYIQEQKLQSQVSAADTPRGIAITLNDLLLFDLGKADLKPAAFPVLDKLATLLPTLNTTVSIEGHTDNLPLSPGSAYKDNWGLSNARSLSVLRYFIYNAHLDDRKFISTGYADTKPVAENNSDENRQKNRRVEIVVLRNN
jgi:chemotaxis protein MotB